MKKIIIGIIVVVILALGGWWLFGQSTQAPVVDNTPAPSNQTGTINNPDQTNPVGPKHYEITYTDAGYSPSTLTIKAGDTVTWKNQSSGGDWVASAAHPSHTVYSGTNLNQHCPDTSGTAFDECKADNPGDSWSFTFTKTGTWGYHNHVNASKFGKVVVE